MTQKLQHQRHHVAAVFDMRGNPIPESEWPSVARRVCTACAGFDCHDDACDLDPGAAHEPALERCIATMRQMRMEHDQ